MLNFDKYLQTKFIGRNVVARENIPSTNDLAKKLAADNAPDGTIVIADEQSAGRGRLNRGWYSPKGGGLWFTLILRPGDFVVPADAAKFTLLTAVAVVFAMQKFSLTAKIKWPNDILFDGKKLVGILTEMSATDERINYIIVGAGINVNIVADDFPTEIAQIATSLSVMNGAPLNEEKFLAAFLAEFEKLYFTVKQEGAFASVLNKWREHSATLGNEVNVIGVGETFAGVAEDIDNDGALLVRTAAGLRKVLAGDVSVRSRRN